VRTVHGAALATRSLCDGHHKKAFLIAELPKKNRAFLTAPALAGISSDLIQSQGAWTAAGASRSASALMHRSVKMVQTWRRIMKALIAALALTALIAAPTFAQPANAAPMSPASSSFGSNGY
jgi:hypothetical protein